MVLTRSHFQFIYKVILTHNVNNTDSLYYTVIIANNLTLKEHIMHTILDKKIH